PAINQLGSAQAASQQGTGANPELVLNLATSSGSGGVIGGLDKTRSDLGTANTRKGELAKVAQPLQGVAQKAAVDPAMNQALMNAMNQAMMAMMMGSMLGGGNSCGDDTNPCNDRMQMPVTAWVINLNDNSQPITMDKTGISAYWEKDNMKLIGQYERQDIGVIFENTGIANPEPVYSTASIKAKQTRHSPTITFPNVGKLGGISGQMLQMTSTGMTGPSPVPGTTQTVTQKFHLKFTTMDFIAPLPPVIGENSCLQGTMIGATGETALPKVALNWNWGETGITKDSCIESAGGIYCDAAQFSIMLSKRLKILEEFLEQNSNMPCPENPGAEAIQEITKNYNQYLAGLGLEPMPANMQAVIGCWIPKSTLDIGNVSGTGSKTAIEYYLENEGSVNWTKDIRNIDDLRKLLKFKAYLMKDNYNNNFKTDFADYYTKTALLNAPDWFTQGSTGKWADYFYSEGKLSFTRKNIDSTELLGPGTYEVSLNIDFNDDWHFFDSEGKPKAKILAVLNYLQEPYPNSVFYYMPFNGNVGRNSSAGRNGYGLNYQNESEPFIIFGTGAEVVSTGIIPSSAGTTTLSSTIVKDAKSLNSIASQRGVLLKINQAQDNALNLAFSPNYATPVSMQISSEKNPDAFGAFYQLMESGTPKQTGSHLAFWSAMGQCYDFTGVPLADRFDFTADRQAEPADPVTNWQFSYGVDWDKAEKSGNVYLRTIFYTPAGAAYSLTGIIPGSLDFSTPETGFQKTADLAGITGMPHNNQKANDTVSSMETLFEMVKSKSVCVTNNGAEALFWWNPNVLYETAGSNNSQKSLNESVQCIKS
ncbi:MAG: hypothetical protein PHH08_03120, partial [Candidatus ainarchaeum sp.]|nr:hypothetical protein [Candidatus ainarchaeum sp.]